jgi:integrase
MTFKATRKRAMASATVASNQREDSSSNMIDNYIQGISIMSKGTSHEYLTRLKSFDAFIKNEFGGKLNVNDLVTRIKQAQIDPYDILSKFSGYLQSSYNITTLTLKQRVVTVKNFFEYFDIEITPRKFKLKVKLPRIIKRSKEALSKEDIIDVLNACSDIKLKTYVMLLAGTGMRATEALSVRVKDLDLQSNPATVFVRGEYTKTKTDRTVFLTQEMVQQLNSWLSYKYRTRRVCYKDEQTGKSITDIRTPEKKHTDLIFAVYQNTKTPAPISLYTYLARSFGKTLDRMNKGDREDGSNERRRKITLHSFRRFVKTTISDLGYGDYSEWFIGHSGSTYWRKKESEKAELFKKIEPYLTFLNIHQLERQGADIQSKVQELEDLNTSLTERDKVKDDAIAHLSDQLLALSTRLQELVFLDYSSVVFT